MNIKKVSSRVGLHAMELHEVLHLNDGELEILRVPGGWVYTTYCDNGVSGYSLTSCLVPYSDEFRSPEAKE